MSVNKAVILAAGKGTRFLPYTKAHPKEMLAVLDVPSVQLIVEEVVASGITDIMLVISPDKQDICRYFTPDNALVDDLERQGKHLQAQSVRRINTLAHFTFAYQPVPDGTGRAVQLARSWCNGEPFAVLNGDDVIFGKEPATLQLARAYDRVGAAIVGVQPVERSAISAYASCKVRGCAERLYRLDDIVEKPSLPEQVFSLLAPLGRYVFTSEIFDLIDAAPQRNGEVYLTDAIRILASRVAAYAYDFVGTRYDFGDKLGYAEGFAAYVLNSEQYGAEYRRFLESLLRQ